MVLFAGRLLVRAVGIREVSSAALSPRFAGSFHTGYIVEFASPVKKHKPEEFAEPAFAANFELIKRAHYFVFSSGFKQHIYLKMQIGPVQAQNTFPVASYASDGINFCRNSSIFFRQFKEIVILAAGEKTHPMKRLFLPLAFLVFDFLCKINTQDRNRPVFDISVKTPL
jgi:hypothetical protein